jgi:hypothetical protein
MVGRGKVFGCDGESPVDAFGNEFCWMLGAIGLRNEQVQVSGIRRSFSKLKGASDC